MLTKLREAATSVMSIAVGVVIVVLAACWIAVMLGILAGFAYIGFRVIVGP